MIVKYIDRAMSKAVYDKLDDGSFYGKIPQCPGVIAFGKTLYQCEQEVKASLEGWLIVKLRHGDKLPVISNISLNKRNPSVPGEAATLTLPSNEEYSISQLKMLLREIEDGIDRKLSLNEWERL